MTRSRRQRNAWTITGDSGDYTDDMNSVRSLDRGEMSVVFQPIVDLGTGRSFAVEALARCARAQFRSPVALFAAAVEQGATGRLGRLIRDIAFDHGAGQRLFVNIHPNELSSRWLVRTDDPLCYHDSEVFLEITETAAFEYFGLCQGVLREVCQRTGAHLAVDDLGAGYSNLTRVLDLEPKVVKIDRALVSELHLSRRKQVLLRHLTRLCVELGATVVAEGIEELDELKAVIDAGVHYGQGYLMARPGHPPPDVSWPL